MPWLSGSSGRRSLMVGRAAKHGGRTSQRDLIGDEQEPRKGFEERGGWAGGGGAVKLQVTTLFSTLVWHSPLPSRSTNRPSAGTDKGTKHVCNTATPQLRMLRPPQRGCGHKRCTCFVTSATS